MLQALLKAKANKLWKSCDDLITQRVSYLVRKQTLTCGDSDYCETTAASPGALGQLCPIPKNPLRRSLGVTKLHSLFLNCVFIV